MIRNNQEVETTLERIERFQKQVERIREVETNHGIMSYPRAVSLPKLTR